MENDTVWLMNAQLVELYQSSKANTMSSNVCLSFGESAGAFSLK